MNLINKILNYSMYYKLIILFLIFIILLFLLTKKDKKEHFQTKNIFSGNKNLFVEKNNDYDFDTINVNKLCIKDTDSDIVECISKNELFNALELPKFRRHSVCIDDACIEKSHLSMINGGKQIDFKSKLVLNDSEQCINSNKIQASPSVRKKWKWESGKYYSSLYEPDEGWDGAIKKGKKRKCGSSKKSGGCYRCFNYGEEDDAKDLYGCKLKHNKINWRDYILASYFSAGLGAAFIGLFISDKKKHPNCFRASGRRCQKKRQKKRIKYKMKKPSKRYDYEADPIDEVSTLESINCSDNDGFKLEKGKFYKDLNLSELDYDIYGSQIKKAQHLTHNNNI